MSCMPDLQSLLLHACTALEELKIDKCELLDTLEDLQSLGSLRCLEIDTCPSLHPCLERLSMQGPELCPRLSRLEKLCIPGTSLLTTSFCKHLGSLQCLKLSDCNSKMTRLTDEQGSVLQSLTSLRDLEFWDFEKLINLPADLKRLVSLEKLCIRYCNGLSNLTEMVLPASLQVLELLDCRKLVHLPAGLHSLPFLKKLRIRYCYAISRLPVMGLPHSLEELDISLCTPELDEECRKLATRKLKVKIGGTWIN